MVLKIYFFSKLKDPYRAVVMHFLKQLKSRVRVLEKPDIKNPVAGFCLDPGGKILTPELLKKILLDREDIVFIIGGPDGIPSTVRCLGNFSLSPLVFNHQLALVVLLEQIYRVVKPGHPYTKH